MTTRTDSQNRALHKWFEIMADGLNQTDASLQKVCTLPIDITKDNFKENIFRPVMNAMYPDITSTTKLSTTQLQDVYEQVNKIIGERWGVSAPFPSEEE